MARTLAATTDRDERVFRYADAIVLLVAEATVFANSLTHQCESVCSVKRLSAKSSEITRDLAVDMLSDKKLITGELARNIDRITKTGSHSQPKTIAKSAANTLSDIQLENSLRFLNATGLHHVQRPLDLNAVFLCLNFDLDLVSQFSMCDLMIFRLFDSLKRVVRGGFQLNGEGEVEDVADGRARGARIEAGDLDCVGFKEVSELVVFLVLPATAADFSVSDADLIKAFNGGLDL